MRTWIGLGSNMGDGPGNIREALRRLQSRHGVRVVRRSHLYSSAPLGDLDQADFTNAVAELDTHLEPLQLLERLHHLEDAMGRRRGPRRWGPRVIDLDILLIGDRIVVLEGLIVPHPRMHRRAFVLQPLADLEPGLIIPGRGSVRGCLERITGQQLRRLETGPDGE